MFPARTARRRCAPDDGHRRTCHWGCSAATDGLTRRPPTPGCTSSTTSCRLRAYGTACSRWWCAHATEPAAQRLLRTATTTRRSRADASPTSRPAITCPRTVACASVHIPPPSARAPDCGLIVELHGDAGSGLVMDARLRRGHLLHARPRPIAPALNRRPHGPRRRFGRLRSIHHNRWPPARYPQDFHSTRPSPTALRLRRRPLHSRQHLRPERANTPFPGGSQRLHLERTG